MEIQVIIFLLQQICVVNTPLPLVVYYTVNFAVHRGSNPPRAWCVTAPPR